MHLKSVFSSLQLLKACCEGTNEIMGSICIPVIAVNLTMWDVDHWTKKEYEGRDKEIDRQRESDRRTHIHTDTPTDKKLRQNALDLDLLGSIPSTEHTNRN